MLEGHAPLAVEGGAVAVEVAHEVALAVARHAVAEDEVVHAAAHVDRVDLHVGVVREGGGDVGRGGVEEHRAAVEAAGVGGGDVARRHRRHPSAVKAP
jgi:hypothetical protein